MKKLMSMLPLVVSLLGCSLSRGGVASYSVVCTPYASCVSCEDLSSPGYTWMALGLANPLFWHFGSYWEYLRWYEDVPYYPDFAYISPPEIRREPVKRRIEKDQLQDPGKQRGIGDPEQGYPGSPYSMRTQDPDISRSDQGPPPPSPPDNDRRMSSPPATISPPPSPPDRGSSGREQGSSSRKKK